MTEYKEIKAFIEAAQALRKARAFTTNDELDKMSDDLEKHVHSLVDSLIDDWDG